LCIIDTFSHRFPFASFRAIALGYVVTSLRNSGTRTVQIESLVF
jgi:hypothetical protein